MSGPFLVVFLRVFVTIFLFPVGWAALVVAIILVNAPFKYMNSGCSNFSNCFIDNVISAIQGQKFLTEICIALIIGAIVVFVRLLELWLEKKRGIP